MQKMIVFVILMTICCFPKTAFCKKPKKLFMRILKKSKVLELWESDGDGAKYKLFKSYPICYFSGKLGPKTKQGDLQAPEGIYTIKRSSLNPNSRFHLSMNVGYPNKYDIQKKRTGNFIMIHGGCVSVGCFAMTDELIEEIYNKVEETLKYQKRIPLHIFPFHLSFKNLMKERKNKWLRFWIELEPIYTFFERTRNVPQVRIKNKRYLLGD